MKTLSALVCCKNEEDFIGLCLDHLVPYCDQIVVIDNGSTDRTKEIASKYDKVEVYDFPETNDMSEVRNFSLSKATSDWILQCDPDEIYPASEMQKMREFIDTAEEHGYISARVHYKNLAWRSGYAQSDFGHYPDRLYRRDVIDAYRGILPVDMTYAKKEYLSYPNKTKGDIGPLEYDNADDISAIHPKQPIIDVTYYHLARTRGYNKEYTKWMTYNRNMHPNASDEELNHLTRVNQWVSGQYDIERVDVPTGIPSNTISNPKVSVIITNFEYEKYVGEAIQSVLDQTVKSYEIIVVDDCSYDNSRDVIDRFPVTKIYRKENGGPSAARNEGIARATGDYFLLLDADDKLKTDAIENLLKGIGTNQVCYGDMEWVGERNGVWEFPDFDREKMLSAQIIPSVCALVDRHAFDASGGFNIHTHFEDWFFWLTLSEKLKLDFVHIPKVILEYRDHHSVQKCRSDHANPQREEVMKYFRQNFPTLKV